MFDLRFDLNSGNCPTGQHLTSIFRGEVCKEVRAMYCHKSQRHDETLLTMPMRDIANTVVRYGLR